MPSAKKHVVGKNVDMKILPQLAIRNAKPIPSIYSGAVMLCATIFPTTKHFLIVSFWCVFLGHIFGTLSVYTPKKGILTTRKRADASGSSWSSLPGGLWLLLKYLRFAAST